MAARPTLAEVAKAAGVSTSTASRALGEASSRVAPETRDRIRAAAEDVGYSPNSAARHLIGGKWDAVGLVVPDLANPYFTAVLKGIEAEAQRCQLAVTVAGSDEDAAREEQLALGLSDRVDAVILCSSRLTDDAIAELSQTVPVVLVNRSMDAIASVSMDQSRVMQVAVEHLYALGHRNIAYVRGPELSWSNARRAEALDVIASDYGDMRVCTVGPFSPVFDSGPAAVDLVIAQGCTALIACNDLVAAGALTRLKDRGISVPDDFSVVGIDDSLSASLVSPSLTSVHTSNEQLGRSAVTIVRSLLERGQVLQELRSSGVELRVRKSTGVVQAGLTV